MVNTFAIYLASQIFSRDFSGKVLFPATYELFPRAKSVLAGDDYAGVPHGRWGGELVLPQCECLGGETENPYEIRAQTFNFQNSRFRQTQVE